MWFYKGDTELTTFGDGAQALIARVEGETDLDRLHALSRVIEANVSYELGSSLPTGSAEEAISAGKGV